jgi:rsbT co-antagonist protein RsbR
LLLILRDTSERRRIDEERIKQREELRAQRELLSQISAPLMPIADGVIAMPLVGPMTDDRVRELLEVLLGGVVAHRASVVILDVTGVSTMNAEAAGELLRAAKAVQLLGAEVVISGIRPAIATHMISLGVELQSLHTTGQFQAAIAYALDKTRARQR